MKEKTQAEEFRLPGSPSAADPLHQRPLLTLYPLVSLSADPAVQTDGSPLCCHFHFSPKVMFTKVLKAQLWVYLRPVPRPATVYLQILRLKPLTGEGTAGGGGAGRRHIRIRSLKIELHSRSGHWQSIDFKQVLHSWFRQPQSNWGVEINAFDPSGTDLAVTSLGPGAEGLVSREPEMVADMCSLQECEEGWGPALFLWVQALSPEELEGEGEWQLSLFRDPRQATAEDCIPGEGVS